jgi:hypothetical protein
MRYDGTFLNEKGQTVNWWFEAPSDEALRAHLDEAVAIYNQTPHESLQNVSPNDVYAGRKEAILKARAEKKRLTLERRKQYNLNRDPNPAQSANSNPDSVSKKV